MAKFITIEGIEGVGKSTALQFLQQYFLEKGQPIVITREPGGTPLAEHLRQLVLMPTMDEPIMPETELLLMFAARVQHIAQVIRPALLADKWVLSDRFVDATFAYQGGGRGIALSHITMLEDWLVKPLLPDLTILLDAPAEIGLARAKHRGKQDRIEQEKIEFFTRVRESYLTRAKEDPKRFYVIDAAQSLEDVQKELKNAVELK